MNHIITAKLVKEVTSKDITGQTVMTKSYSDIIGKQSSVYEREFYKAEQAGLRAEGVIETSAFDYDGERLILIDKREFSIYRTFLKGTDRIELYYGERVGNGKQ